MKWKLWLRNKFPLISQFIFILLVVYVLFILGRSIYKNYQTNKKITNLENEITRLGQENQYLQNIILYYQTDSFKEVEARRKLNMQKPGEKVMAVELQSAPEVEALEDSLQNITQESNQANLVSESNALRWKEFLFGK